MYKNIINTWWCNEYVCWVRDVDEITEGTYDCNLDCTHCEMFYCDDSSSEKSNVITKTQLTLKKIIADKFSS